MHFKRWGEAKEGSHCSLHLLYSICAISKMCACNLIVRSCMCHQLNIKLSEFGVLHFAEMLNTTIIQTCS